MRSQMKKRKEDNRIKISNTIRISLMTLSIVVIAFGSGNLIKDLTGKTEMVTEGKELYKYDNKYSCNAKINLKENSYVDENDMIEGQTYLSDLISDIDMKLKYDYIASLPSEVTYNYKIEAIMKASYTNTKNTYDILNKVDTIKEGSSKANGTKKVTIDEDVNIEYGRYHKLMKEFKQAMGITADSQLFVRFTVNTSTEVNSKQVDNEYVANYKISLGDKVAVIDPIENKETSKTIKNENMVTEKANINFVLAAVHIVVIAAGVVLMIFVIKKTKELKVIRNEYKVELNRILKSYEDKIVEIQDLNAINLDKSTRVKDIVQLRKLAEEALVPMYCYIKEDEAYFIVTKYENSYIYILR